MEVAAGVHRLTKGVVNWYVVEDAGKLVVIDAGTPGDWELLVETVGRLGHRLADIDAVLVTHAHPDHTGFAERARTTAGSRVWIHEADAAVAGGAKQPKTDGNVLKYLVQLETYRTAVSLVRRGATRVVPIRELSTFADGEVLDVPGRPRVVHAPGHTPGTAAIHLEVARRPAHRRRAGDTQPPHRAGRAADHAVGVQRRHPGRAALARRPARGQRRHHPPRPR